MAEATAPVHIRILAQVADNEPIEIGTCTLTIPLHAVIDPTL